MADIYPLAADLLFGGAHLNPTIHVAASHMMYVAASHIWYVEYIYIYILRLFATEIDSQGPRQPRLITRSRSPFPYCNLTSQGS